MARDRFGVKPGDIILSALILCAAALFLTFAAGGGEARTLVIKSPDGETRLDMSRDTEYELTSRGYTLTIEIRDGSACVSHADCPDRICVSSGRISSPGKVIACVPAGVTISAEGGEADDGIDWVAP